MKSLLLLIAATLISINVSAQNCATTGDRDGDGLCDDVDPCPDTFNMNPVDLDKDNVFDECDNSPLFNPDQADIDGDGIGDVSDPCIDPDNDGVCGADDKCPGQDDRIDIDRDGIPDACDDCIDQDADGICDDEDDCLGSITEGNSCNDGNPCTINDRLDDNCNCFGAFQDTDGDGVCDVEDQCPGKNDNDDFDNDGVPDACDDDAACSTCETDDRGRLRMCHVYPNGTASTFRGTCEQVSRFFTSEGDFVSSKDHCGPCVCADSGDVDTDGDGICDKQDPCPNDASDSDGDGVCDSKDVCPGSDDNSDADADGIPDGCDDIEYCVPAYDNTMEWISAIQVNDKLYDNRQSSSLTLHDDAVQLEKGNEHTLTITPEIIDNVCEVSMAVYIDRNGDGDFDDRNEEISSIRSLSEIQILMTVDNYEVGIYRMRVILHYGRITSACQESIDGEVEDMLLEVIAQQPCTEVSEDFSYDANQELVSLSRGEGWIGAWDVSASASDQVVVLANSLNESDDNNKIGILNNGASTINLSREIEVDLGGSEQLYYSMYVQRLSGDGSMVVSLGGVQFGINVDGQLYLNEEIGVALSMDQVYNLKLAVSVNPNGEEDLVLVVSSASGEESLSSAGEIGDVINSLSITTTSTNSFLPLAHYVDDIRLGCEVEDAVAEIGRSKKRNLKKVVLSNTTLSIDLWPNPTIDAEVWMSQVDVYPKVLFSEGIIDCQC